MKTVAAYALECVENGQNKYDEARAAVAEWLKDKGWVEDNEDEFKNTHGNRSRALKSEATSELGQLTKFVFVEQFPEGVCSTEVSIGYSGDRCALFVELRITGLERRVSPFRFDARRPKFIGRLLNSDLCWQLGETPLTDRAYKFVGRDGGARAVEMLWHRERSVPAVVVSLIEGGSITSNFVEKLAGDLAGLAIVATLDEAAGWEITNTKGPEWSCFNGAVRLFWPMGDRPPQHRQHPLWLFSSIAGGAADRSGASYRMRAQLRRRILSVAALSVREPKLIRDLNQAARRHRQQELESALRASSSSDEYRAIAESYADENDKLREELRAADEKHSALEDQVAELQLALRYVGDNGEVDMPPDVVIHPATVEEALRLAEASYSGRLVFGDAVEDGVKSLDPSAGPPEKILRYLESLSELAIARDAGTLGEGVVPWLASRGVVCSVESESIRNAGGRKWNVDGERVSFDYHLKPSDAVSPDRCVRIYFSLDKEGTVIIGWLGRHPE